MKSVRLVTTGTPLQQQDTEIPDPGEFEVLVRVKAAGICHSDTHYRSGLSSAGPLPLTLGHEVAGTVQKIGSRVKNVKIGDRVCLHYLVTCGTCEYCRKGFEQFCVRGSMLGKHRHGGYAEHIVVPQRNAVPLPAEIPFEHGAILMCSSSTCLHALKKARLQPGEVVAVFGAGGLGMSAIQIARALEASVVYAIDINKDRLSLAEKLGAVPILADRQDPVAALRAMTYNRGVDVAMELVGLPQTARQAVQSLAILGRAVMVGLGREPFDVQPYTELIGREAEIIGSSDHLLSELPELFDLVRRKKLNLESIVTDTVPLHEEPINRALDELERFGRGVRTVIVP
ncbi:MAG TPA: zinc-binding dehydrogenase [Bacteroidota bacterium]|nr:zinc-binding dehydrogenase [Bacteroidota bacterium]